MMENENERANARPMKAAGNGATRIRRATTAAEIMSVHPVMRELRPLHADERAFVRQVERQMRSGYRLVFLESEHEVRAVASYRILELLFSVELIRR